MRIRSLTLIATLSLLLSFPLLAQVPPESQPLDPTPQTSDEVPVDRSVTDEDYAVGESDVSPDAANQDLYADHYGDADALPRTASPLALLALLGLGGAGSAFGLRRIRRK